jgi:excisionase family DNA binding protein
MKELTQEQTFLNRREVADLLRCSLGTIDNLVSQGKLKKLGYNRLVLFNKQEVIDDLISSK